MVKYRFHSGVYVYYFVGTNYFSNPEGKYRLDTEYIILTFALLVRGVAKDWFPIPVESRTPLTVS